MEIVHNIKKSDTWTLQQVGIRIWTKSFATSPIPVLLLNRSLKIIWYNQKFSTMFGENEGLLGTPIEQYYFSSLDKDRITELRSNIFSSHYGFTWTGRVEKKGVKQLSVITNLLVLPIFGGVESVNEPTAYACILDNISDEYKQMLKGTFLSLLEASRLKDNDTGNHIERVNRYARCLAEKLYGDERFPVVDMEFIEDIGFLAALHDVGKIGTPDDILNKKQNLEEWEWNIMKEHTINGAYILSTYPNPMAKEIALYHHEKWDGSGYPFGLKEVMIPVSARIVTIGDVYDALRMQRSYKQPMEHANTVQIMENEMQGKFDPVIMDFFQSNAQEFKQIFDTLKDK